MYTRYIVGILMLCTCLPVQAQIPVRDSLGVILLPEVVVEESYRQMQNKKTPLSLEVVGKDFLRNHFTGNLVQSLGNIPGVQSMDIGSGFSKPVIRGFGFNRVSVVENGIKQEGQQWGADHGLEIDPFNAGQVSIRKGPASLLYGSDAMGGAIEIAQAPMPDGNQIFGEVVLLGKSVNASLGGSVLLGLKKNNWYTRFRFSEQHFGDYRIPADTIVYLTQKMPVHNGRLKNTAGFERDVNFYTAYRKGSYNSNYNISNVYQKVGFFPGAHGIPDISRLEDDGDSRNIGLPYSNVNHFKVTTRQQYIWDRVVAGWDLAYQNNRREEWSLFHTHYASQPMPASDPDKELAFRLNTYSSAFKLRFTGSSRWEHTGGWDVQYQRNTIAGYSFLLPEYKRFTSGVLWLTTFRPSRSFSVSGGVRYDFGKVNIDPFTDPYLEAYLREQGYGETIVGEYGQRSHRVNRRFGDYSCSLGVVWTPVEAHLLKANIGRSFRLPGANELASNGVHHGTFRHEQGDASLDSEQGWQVDLSYAYEKKAVSFSISPFVSWFSNYIFLRPTGEWSVLPHAGQIYRYTGAEALFAGAELAARVDLCRNLSYELSGEYVYTYNCDEKIPLSFSPPFTLRNALTWTNKYFRLNAEYQHISRQNRIARNEDPTPGANLLHAMFGFEIPAGKTKIEVTLMARNLFDTKYYNHLSFYRKVEIPEPGRNFQVLIKLPFNKLIK